MAMERIIKPPIIPQFEAIMYVNEKYTSDLRKRLSREKSCEETQKKDGILSVDEDIRAFMFSPNVLICDALYLGTKNSASNRVQNADYKITIGIGAQLHFGVRFLDFEITTFERVLWVVCSGKLAMLGTELFQILKGFADNQRLAGNHLEEKIILNFREHERGFGCLMPTWELLGDLIIHLFEPNRLGTQYFVSKHHRGELLKDMVGVFIILAPEDLDLALDDNYSNLNWRSDSIVKVAPKFNGGNDCILQWANLQEVNNYNDFPENSRQLVWLDISDPNYKGNANHEIQSMHDGKLLYPDIKPRFNVISFGNLNSTNVNKFLKNAPKKNIVHW